MSCVPNKSLLYLKPPTEIAQDSAFFAHEHSKYRLKPNDVLFIDFISLDPKVSELFESMGADMPNQGGGGGQIFYITGNPLDQNGSIKLPMLGEMKLLGLTVQEAKIFIQAKLDELFIDAIAKVSLVSFRITVLGEVSRPGMVFVQNDQLTILEAIGLAGDLTVYGNRQKIRLVRPTDEGDLMVTLDISSRDIFNSEYFYLAPGDVLYVEPVKAGQQRFNYSVVSLVLSTLTTLVALISLTTR